MIPSRGMRASTGRPLATPVIQSVEPGEAWRWNFATEQEVL